jgi:hypothetical protein
MKNSEVNNATVYWFLAVSMNGRIWRVIFVNVWQDNSVSEVVSLLPTRQIARVDFISGERILR